MKLKRYVPVLLILLSAARIFAQAPSPKSIRADIIAYTYYSQLFVKRARQEYAILRTASLKLEYLPQSFWRKNKTRNFIVTPRADCRAAFWNYRYNNPMWCDVGEPIAPPVNFTGWEASYPLFVFIDEIYRKEAKLIDDFKVLPCFEVDLEKSKLPSQERLITGSVVGKENLPLRDFPVSVGFKGDKNRLFFVKTNNAGRFAFSLFSDFSYWLSPGLAGDKGQKKYKAIPIVRNTKVKPIEIKLDDGN